MPLDPQVKRILDAMAAMEQRPMQELTPEEARQVMGGLALLARHPDPLPAAEDRTVPGPAGPIPIRVYRPHGDGPMPVVVYFHGGGWVIGSIDSHDATCEQLAVRVPAVVVSVEYRLAPEHPFPAPYEDCLAATRWVHDHAVDLGGDPDRMAVAGDSAGGNLAALVCIGARRGGPRLAFQLLVYPATDLTATFPSHETNGHGYLLERESIAWFLDHYIPEADRKSPQASPYFVDDLSGLPPALVITAEFDPLRDEGEAYAYRLREAGVPATAERYDGMIHGFFGMDGALDQATAAMEEAARALRAALYA